MCLPLPIPARRSTYKQLGLLTYFTTGEKETRAWTIREGMTAPQAAGVIHTGGAGAGAARRAGGWRAVLCRWATTPA